MRSIKLFKNFGVVVILLQTTQVMAWNPFDSKLQAYKCNNAIDARSCSNCVALDGLLMDFKVSVDKSLVTGIFYKGGEQVSSSPYQNCKVIDKNNWSCEESSDIGITYSRDKQSMTNGKFFSWNYFGAYPNQRRGIRGGESEFFGCAK